MENPTNKQNQHGDINMKQYKTVELNVYGKSIIVRNDGKLFWKENE